MKKYIVLIFLIVIMVVMAIIFKMNVKEKSTVQNFSDSNITEKHGDNNTTTNINDINDSIERNDDMNLYIKVNNRILIATLESNSSVDQLLEKLKKQDIIINMEDYANFEKVGYLGFDLIKNDKQITTVAGDIILYQGNQFVIYYDTNSWNFTKLGHIYNVNQEELKQILGNGNVTVTLSLERK